jgi:hypothetical protein
MVILPVMIIEIAEIFGKSPSKASLSGLKNIPPLIKQKYETILQTTKYRISKQKSLNNIIAQDPDTENLKLEVSCVN